MSDSRVFARTFELAVADLRQTKPWPAFLRTLICIALFVPGAALGVASPEWYMRVLGFICTALSLVPLFITTHDALHHTYSGIKWIDEVMPRLVAWPFLWFHGTYKAIHRIHHNMNGSDLADPERVQWTEDEYNAASPVTRWYVRNQWLIDVFVFGGFGLIAKTVIHARRHASKSRQIRRGLLSDSVGILGVNALIYGVAFSYGWGWDYMLFYFMEERIVGGFLQYRAHIEHYGLWSKGGNFTETQVWNCRNVTANRYVGWFFNNLNYHSIHHAFADIPFYNLPEAHRRLEKIIVEQGRPSLVQDRGYAATGWRLARNPSLIQNIGMRKV